MYVCLSEHAILAVRAVRSITKDAQASQLTDDWNDPEIPYHAVSAHGMTSWRNLDIQNHVDVW